jgi:hypothetical protein
MKVLANDLMHLLAGINFELADTVNITVTPYKVMFTWTEEDTSLVYSLSKKSGIAPASLAAKTYELDTYLLHGLADIIKSQSIQFNKESDFLVEFDFVVGKKNNVSLSVVDSENNGVKNLPLKEVFDTFKLPRSIVDAEFYSGKWETRSHLRLAKYIAENSINPIFLEFIDGDYCDRLKISTFSDEIFLGSVCADCSNGSKFPLIRSPISLSAEAVGKMLSFKDFSRPKWAEYIGGNISLILGDWGDSITTPYEFSNIDNPQRYSQHLFSNKADGWVKVDKNTLQKQLEAICSPVTFTETSVQLPIKSISQSGGEIEIMTEALDQLNQLTKIGLLELQATALLDSWEIPDPKMIYNNIIQLELGDGYLTITGNDDRKQKIKLKGSNPNAFGNWQGDGKKLIKILSLIEEYDGRLEIIMEHPRLQIQTTSGASILLLGCDLVGINDIIDNDETTLDWWHKPIQLLPEVKGSELELDDIFFHQVSQIKQFKKIAQKMSDWVTDIEYNDHTEDIASLLERMNTLAAFIPEESYIPKYDECFQEDEELYWYGSAVAGNLSDFLEEMESLKDELSMGLGKVYQYCCKLPSLMQYLF